MFMDNLKETEEDSKCLPWSEIFEYRQGKHPVTLELKIVLYLYLLMRGPDYGYNIHKAFVKAEKEEIWKNRIGLSDLTQKQGSSKINAALNYMADIGILCRYKDVKKYIPKSFLIDGMIKKELKKNATKRIYYSLNYEVIAERGFMKLITPEHTSKKHLEDLGEKGEKDADWALEDYYKFIWHALMIIRTYDKTEQDSIQYINRIAKYDYLTILLAFDKIIQDLLECHIRNLLRPSDGSPNKEWFEKQKTIFFNDDQKIDQMMAKHGKKINDWEIIYVEQFQGIIRNRILAEVRKDRLPKK
jgi:hypothetical protein